MDSHAYSLVGCYDLRNGDTRIRLVKIRNPWGLQEWHGDWSDSSPLWTPELMQQVNMEAKEDGVFFISFQDYLRFFYITSICKYLTGNDLSAIEDEHSQSKFCV
jgi:calpain-15